MGSMKDKNGFLVHCIYCDWKIINDREDKDFVCSRNGYLCYADENCPHYKPERTDDGKRETD